jgi:hypothetical protein
VTPAGTFIIQLCPLSEVQYTPEAPTIFHVWAIFPVAPRVVTIGFALEVDPVYPVQLGTGGASVSPPAGGSVGAILGGTMLITNNNGLL